MRIFFLKKGFFFLILTTGLFSIGGCKGGSSSVGEVDSFSFFGSGDLIHSIKIYSPSSRDNSTFFQDAASILEEKEMLFSWHNENSEISKINNAAGLDPVVVSQETSNLLKSINTLSEQGDNLFDMTIGPLVRLWDISDAMAFNKSPNTLKVPPLPEEINKTLSLVQYNSSTPIVTIDMTNSHVKLHRKGMALDLGGVIKGYMADSIYSHFIEKQQTTDLDVTGFILNLGGNVMVGGSKSDGSPFTVGVRIPWDAAGSHLGQITVPSSHNSVVTSGNYERYFIYDDTVYHHLLHPGTGYPTQNGLTSVTVLSKTSLEGDIFSTILFIMGLKKGMAFVNEREDIEAIFINDESEVFLSSGLEGIFTLTNESFTVVALLE